MRLASIVGKTTLRISQKLKIGSGSTWPGHISLKIDPFYIKKVIDRNPDLKVILIAGTNGKTTTTKALAYVLEYSRISTLTNKEGANLLNGLATLLSTHASLSGSLNHKAIVFEVDENTLPNVLEQIPNPTGIILLNLFRDQLDRYGEVNSIAEKWKRAFEKVDERTIFIANADDPLVAFSVLKNKNINYFSIPKEFKTQRSLTHAVDSTTCPSCRSPLTYLNISYSHLGNYICPNCNFKTPKENGVKVKTNLLGTYSQYNLNAVVKTAKIIFKIKEPDVLKILEDFTPAFGRQEKIVIDGRNIMFLLSKNPTGFNESLKVATDNKTSTIMLILNDRIPDGRDISWIWDVDFELLKNKKINIVVSGDRAHDMSNRLIFADVKHDVIENLNTAYKKSIEKTPADQLLTILPTYSAMLELRKIALGKSIL